MKNLKIKTLKIAMVVVLGVATFILSCKKEVSPILASADLKIQNKMAVVPTHVFDWETADYMPTPSGSSPILVPWASGSNQLFPDEIAFDFKKADGWNLVYNTFSPTQLTSPNFFALYNKYRGIIRFYLYLPPGSPYASSYFSDGLGISGEFPSSIMNFSKEIIDPENVQKSVTKIQNYQILSTGAWYACQYEVAYDPTIVNSNQENLNFVWNVSSTNLSEIVLNGVSNGTLNGTVGTATPGGFNLGSLLGNLGNTAIHVAGFKAIGKLKLPKSKLFGTDLTKAIEDGVKGGLSGAVKGFFSAILGGSATSPQVVDLKLKVETNLTGSIKSSTGIVGVTLVMPGAANNNSTGFVPNYNKVLGVVDISLAPELFVSNQRIVTNESGSSSTNPKYIYDYSIALHHGLLSGYQQPTNPEVTSDGTTVKVTRIDVLVPYKQRYESNGPPSEKTTIERFLDRTDPAYGLPENYGKEIIGDEIYAYGSNTSTGTKTSIQFKVQHRQDYTMGTTYYNASDLDGIRIRYTILVTPSNGSQPVTIIKTVKPTINLV
ncbi:hypothetical protein [Pedobacter psychrotolerans]|uniref:Uncharacterized protein n=2 Tax=Pedobacter psychrotolerans TaxID=1843235 RepID=A0ABQ1SN97_9SPHI|nr:hypothetical protein [Pedobacter psychrotolerans]GGE43272.1 hypothetical protein GCM10011413_06530 [Pedobacter psychrotolerans]